MVQIWKGALNLFRVKRGLSLVAAQLTQAMGKNKDSAAFMCQECKNDTVCFSLSLRIIPPVLFFGGGHGLFEKKFSVILILHSAVILVQLYNRANAHFPRRYNFPICLKTADQLWLSVIPTVCRCLSGSGALPEHTVSVLYAGE